MQSEMPWFETAEDATTSAIQHSGKAFKEVAHALWPSMKMDSAYARLKGALNSERPEKLTADEHLFIANHCERYHFTAYVCAQTHHSQPDPIEPVDEAMELDRRIDANLRDVRKLLERRERLNLKGVA